MFSALFMSVGTSVKEGAGVSVTRLRQIIKRGGIVMREKLSGKEIFISALKQYEEGIFNVKEFKDVGDAERIVILNEYENVVANHKFSIWFSKKDKWSTYFESSDSVRGKRLIRRKDPRQLLYVIMKYYYPSIDSLNKDAYFRNTGNENRNYVYLISNGDEVKIGRSKTPMKRLEKLQTGSSKPLHMIDMVDCKGCASAVELFLQNLFKKYKVLNEWYKISDIIER